MIEVAICVFTHNNKILIGENKNNIWEFPGGKIEKNETALQAIQREIKEELNLLINDFKYCFNFENIINNQVYSLAVFSYELNNCNISSSVHKNLKWIDYQNIKNYRVYPNTDKIVARCESCNIFR